MPTITYHRFWCSKCQEFTLHHTHGEKGCRDCGTVTESYIPKDIPREKLLEQRERYKNSTSKRNVFDTYLKFVQPGGNGLRDILSEEWPKPEIIEDDAGQKLIDERIAEEKEKKWQEQREEEKRLKEEAKKFKGLGRNDKCACGSGKKYKHCCITKYQTVYYPSL
jgi:predicted  nucleic acid-binding Zn-ribbon protein